MAQPFKTSAISVLSDSDAFLTADEIVKEAVRRGLLDEDEIGETPERTMSSVLSNNMRQLGTDSEFVKRGDRFGRNPALHPRAEAREQDSKAPEPRSLQPLFNGRAGEYAVAGELLFEGFDACVANVDEGTDVFAVKDGRCFFIQVKTSVPVRNECSFFIPPGTHKKFNVPDAYYAFVKRSKASNDFLVMPYHEVQKHVESGGIEKMNRKYRATFVWGDQITLGGEDVTYYRRRWPRV